MWRFKHMDRITRWLWLNGIVAETVPLDANVEEIDRGLLELQFYVTNPEGKIILVPQANGDHETVIYTSVRRIKYRWQDPHPLDRHLCKRRKK